MDARLVIRAQDGDEIAFARLADGVYGRLQQLAYRVLRDPDLAHDVAQQTTLSMWRHLRQLRDPQRFEAWCYRMCINGCHTEARRQRRSLPLIDGGTAYASLSPNEFERVIDHDQLERGFKRLSVDHRAVLVLHHYLGMPLEQVAATLDIPLGTVKSRMHRALLQLRRALEADAAPSPGAVYRSEVTR